MLSVCGVSCDGCKSLGNECAADCTTIKGKVFWVRYLDVDVCPVYKCAEDHQYKTCGECAQIPCRTWIEMKDPNMTDEQHRNSIKERVKILTGRDIQI